MQEEFDSYRATAEAVAEAKDAELSMALEGNALLREQLADARAAAAQVHFLRGAVVLEFERSEIGDTARMCNVKGSWSLTVLSQLGKRPGSCSADGMIAGETACCAEQLVQTLHVLAVSILQVPYLSCRLTLHPCHDRRLGMEGIAERQRTSAPVQGLWAMRSSGRRLQQA